jgi:hypothetical protein
MPIGETEETDEGQLALAFLGSHRGQYIMGQALAIAINALKSVEPPELREQSNIADMVFLMKNLFPMGAAMYAIQGKSPEELSKMIMGDPDDGE